MPDLCAAGVAATSTSGAALTVIVDDALQELIHATDPLSAQLDELRLSAAEGPQLDAFRSGSPVLVADLEQQAHRWPTFAPSAVSAGARALFAFPLRNGTVPLGTLTLHRRDSGRLAPMELLRATDHAGTAERMLLADLLALVDPGVAEAAVEDHRPAEQKRSSPGPGGTTRMGA